MIDKTKIPRYARGDALSYDASDINKRIEILKQFKPKDMKDINLKKYSKELYKIAMDIIEFSTMFYHYKMQMESKYKEYADLFDDLDCIPYLIDKIKEDEEDKDYLHETINPYRKFITDFIVYCEKYVEGEDYGNIISGY